MKSVCIEKKFHTRQTWGSTLAVSTLPALVIGAVIFQAAGVSSFRAYAVMLEGAVGNWYAFSEVLVKAIPLMFTGLAVALAARMALRSSAAWPSRFSEPV